MDNRMLERLFANQTFGGVLNLKSVQLISGKRKKQVDTGKSDVKLIVCLVFIKHINR